ncbi:MAG: hypothetical protein IT561_18890 [Alphaproteobacteria bacterium]|nr:hypothetical protein [Alphaproteobacteria bacterium]
MRTTVIVASLALSLAFGAASAQAPAGRDLSAETMALLTDTLAPYRTGATPHPAVDQEVLGRALEALRRERLLDAARPPTTVTGHVERYGTALMLGSRATQVTRELAALHESLMRGDAGSVRDGIRSVYARIGRAPPEGAALDRMYEQLREAHGREPAPTERVEIVRPDYTILVETARAAGRVSADVTMRDGPGGRPARAQFSGDIVTRPDPSGRALETAGRPDPRPIALSEAGAAALRAGLNGRWTDQDGQVWEIAGTGETMTLDEERAAAAPRRYVAAFRLGRIAGESKVTAVGDMDDDLPLRVREQLVGRVAFGLTLVADAAATRLDGVWSSQHVTYSGVTLEVSRIHDPFERRLVLTRSVLHRAALP